MRNQNCKDDKLGYQPLEKDCMRYRVTLTVTIITGSLLIVFGIINVLTEKYYAGFPEMILGFIALVANTYILVIKKTIQPRLWQLML